jgi:predicted HTH transcriptional regulator
MQDDNQNQDIVTPSEDTKTPEIAIPTDIGVPVQPVTSAGVDLPPEAPEGSRDVVDTAVANNDNPVPNQSNGQTPEAVIEPKTTEPAVAVATASASSAPSFLHDLLLRARAKIQFRKGKRLDKIMEALVKKNKISNDDVQKLLYVSDATAARYLIILEQEGKVKQTGRTGKSVFYSKN